MRSWKAFTSPPPVQTAAVCAAGGTEAGQPGKQTLSTALWRNAYVLRSWRVNSVCCSRFSTSTYRHRSVHPSRIRGVLSAQRVAPSRAHLWDNAADPCHQYGQVRVGLAGDGGADGHHGLVSAILSPSRTQSLPVTPTPDQKLLT